VGKQIGLSFSFWFFHLDVLESVLKIITCALMRSGNWKSVKQNLLLFFSFKPNCW
jgi:hypothetical protein